MLNLVYCSVNFLMLERLGADMRKSKLLVLIILLSFIGSYVSAQDWRESEDKDSWVINCKLLHLVTDEFGDFNFVKVNEDMYDFESLMSQIFHECFKSEEPLSGYTILVNPGEYSVSDRCMVSFRMQHDDLANVRLIAIVLGSTEIKHDLFGPKSTERLQADSGFSTVSMKNVIYFTDGHMDGEYKLHLIYEGNLYGLVFRVHEQDSYFFHIDCKAP